MLCLFAGFLLHWENPVQILNCPHKNVITTAKIHFKCLLLIITTLQYIPQDLIWIQGRGVTVHTVILNGSVQDIRIANIYERPELEDPPVTFTYMRALQLPGWLQRKWAVILGTLYADIVQLKSGMSVETLQRRCSRRHRLSVSISKWHKNRLEAESFCPRCSGLSLQIRTVTK